ncbi:MAG: ASKHA domain-containing protein [Eubacterium sp.]|jgi:uncharacterized 2Fe-2S/4Fe-4S cluster protein (DUF4445 family)|nr:ASKHA domain-containing protein [Eubacterium sp.]MCI2197249.1 ASKHA domain-containing protein [Eubacterium sp.]
MPTMHIHIPSADREIECEAGENLMQVLLDNQIYVDNACSGKGLCGKCRVHVLQDPGDEPLEYTDEEIRLLPEKERKEGVHLCCMMDVQRDLTIELMQKEKKTEVLAGGYMPEFMHQPDTSKKAVQIDAPTLEKQTPFEEILKEAVAAQSVDPLALPSGGRLPGMYTAVLHKGRITAVEEGDTEDQLYGAAIDIGTTTVVCSLVDLHSGKILADASQVNAQKHYGQDVLSRITYEMENPDTGAEALQRAIADSINGMLQEACRKAGVRTDQIYELSVAANCTMMHLLLGVDARPLGRSPYAPVFTAAKDIPAASIGIHAARGARLYALPSVSAYIGADIVAGARVCDLLHRKGNVLFIDIGTNGEIVLSHHGKLLCCSCAAGPALEGMNISSGMRAEEGAVEDVKILDDHVELKTIGDTEPAGLCGSGILAAVRELLKAGIVRKTGAFVKAGHFDEDDFRAERLHVAEDGKRSFIFSEAPHEIRVNQSDVRQVQLAKGAILSGFEALLNKAGIEMSDLDEVLIAGQFGAHLPAESLTGTGILPEEVSDRLKYVGNTSRTGAYMALMSGEVKQEVEELSHEMDYMELGATENYEQLFTRCLMFPSKKSNK